MKDNNSDPDLAGEVDEALAAIAKVVSIRELEALRVSYLGRRGSVTGRLKQIGGLPPAQRKAFGQKVNEAKASILAAIKARAGQLGERVRDEVIKSLKTDKPSIAFYLMKDTGLLSHVFPELDVMSGVEIINGKGHKDVFIHTLQVVDNAAQLSDKMKLRFAALVHDIAKPNTRQIDKRKGYTFHGHDAVGERMLNKVARRMKLSNELRDYLMLLTKLHLRPITTILLTSTR